MLSKLFTGWRLKLIIFLLGFLLIKYIYDNTTTVKVGCRVLSHATSSDKSGNITYHTVLDCDDGWLRDEEGLRYYTLPIGSRTTVDKIVWK